MNIFEGKKSPSHYTIVVGCGQLGASLANTLSDGGSSVLIIDSNPKSFSKLSASYGGITLVGDGTEMNLLADADIKRATAVVVVTNNDNINILIAQIAKEQFQTPYVIARLYDPERECVYQEFGIETICPAVLSAKEIDRILNIHQESEGSV